MTAPYTAGTLDQNDLAKPETLLEIPQSNTHPVLIARHMLRLATFIQQLHPDIHEQIKDLSESLRAIRERLVNLASSLVTTNDELIGSIEGLECVMIESIYEANIGNLRRSWVSGRRAMSVAQLMGLNRSGNQAHYTVIDPKTKYQPSHMWFRIVFLDRYLCLLLGVSQGCLDRSMASDTLLANDTPTGRLERMHCVIASRILERNESYPSSHDIAMTRSLDIELQRAARSLPSKWWLAPNLEMDSTNSQALFWNTRRLFAQMLHYNLLSQLHIPYMLRSSSAERKYDYSLITCANASREMLSRFIALRNFNGIACSCRTVDFLALMAAMTLLLAHLDSHPSEAENLLAHQYHSDRAMIEQVQANMEGVNHLNSDSLSAESAGLLGRLLAVEVRTANSCHTRRVSVQQAGTATPLPNRDDDAAVSVHIPYFGVIKIIREGISKAVPKPQTGLETAPRPAQWQAVDGCSTINLGSSPAVPKISSSGLAVSSGIPNDEAITPADAGCVHVEAPSLRIPATGVNDAATCFVPQPLSDPYGEYPGMAAGTEDWAFQGVDLAFFESLIRSGEDEASKGATEI